MSREKQHAGKRRFIAWASTLGIVLVAGCSTPARRIERNRALFDSFPYEVQEKVREGVVDLGYTPEMVAMAAGRPDRVYVRRTGEGVTEIWAYTALCMTPYRPSWTDRYFLYHGADGEPRYASYGRWPGGAPPHAEYETLRIEFTDGTVAAIETVEY